MAPASSSTTGIETPTGQSIQDGIQVSSANCPMKYVRACPTGVIVQTLYHPAMKKISPSTHRTVKIAHIHPKRICPEFMAPALIQAP